jgi:hypothetical protein
LHLSIFHCLPLSGLDIDSFVVQSMFESHSISTVRKEQSHHLE